MVRLKSFFKVAIISSLMVLGWSNFDFTAQEVSEGDRSIGQVIYKDKPVISFYTTGPFVTTFSRAQMTAYRLNEYLEKYEDIDLIRLSYPENIYTASIRGRNLFSVYKEDAKNKNMKVESLMAEWINNIKLSMMLPQTEEIMPSQSIIQQKDKVVTMTTTDDSFIQELKESKDMVLDDIEERVSVLEQKISSVKTKKSSKMLWLFIFINLSLSIYVLFMYKKANKQLGNYEDIEKTGRLEELENAVSVLLKELKDVSGEAVDSVVQTVLEQNKEESVVEEHVEKEKEEDVLKEKIEEESSEIVSETKEDVSDVLPDISQTDIIPEVESKMENNSNVADTLEEALQEEAKSEEVIKKEDIKELEKKVSTQEVSKQNVTKTDAEKLAEELDVVNNENGESEGNVINDPNQSNLSGVGMAELFKILSQLDKEIREEVKTVLNNKMLNKNEKILKMKQMEITNDLIAKVLGIGQEEVNLVIQLNDLESNS